MSSSLAKIGVLLACSPLAGLMVSGCQEGRRDLSARDAARVYPPQPQVPRVVALGTLRGAAPPTKAHVELSMFLFGVEPPPQLTIASPTGLAARDDCVLICDNALSAVFCWDAASGEISEQRFRPSLERPFAIDITPTGDRLICDRGGVVRRDAAGNVSVEYTIESGAFKAAGVLAVGDEVWVTNLAAHRIEVFDTASGRHLRSIGEYGRRRGRFAFPRGLARTPDGKVCVVDTLNNRVQLLDEHGNWVRTVGGPGSAVGSFGRPKDVAVGPDGAIFVTDAFSQRVHAFAPDGEPLLAFGEPGSGVGELTLPNGIAVTAAAPQTEYELPPNASPAYYVLVAEQLNRPGVRVYAWLGNYEPDTSAPLPLDAVAAQPQSPQEAAGPHWDPESCEACHDEGEDRMLPINPEDVDELCLDCHNGHEGAAWAHPVDRVAIGPGLQIPAGWPLVDGRLGCLTCHDIKLQCGTDARRSHENAKLLRRYDPRRARSICMACHVDAATWSGSPHGQLDRQGRLNRQSCLFCHREEPTIPSDGVRRFDAKLRSASGSCLSCHTRHWDYFPAEHVGRLVPPQIRRHMLVQELSGRGELTARAVGALSAQTDRRPAKLPLANGRIACYTCHNPHQGGLFPPGSELATWATSATETAFKLRVDRPGLCLECHEK